MSAIAQALLHPLYLPGNFRFGLLPGQRILPCIEGDEQTVVVRELTVKTDNNARWQECAITQLRRLPLQQKPSETGYYHAIVLQEKIFDYIDELLHCLVSRIYHIGCKGTKKIGERQ